MVASAILRNRLILLLLIAFQVIISTFIAVYYASNIWIDNKDMIIPSSNSSSAIHVEPPLIEIFSKHLDPLCKTPHQNEKYATDCFLLLQSMINISISLNLDSSEIKILSQRIEYLNQLNKGGNHFQQPILYIHIPKTGGTGFGKWMSKHSKMKTLQLWIPDGMTQNMFDINHYPNASRMSRRMISTINQTQNKKKMTKKKPPFPQIIYGHAAHGFDLLFLSAQQIEKLSKKQIIWKPQINFTYITILRNPLTRVPSHYFYHANGAKDENHKWTQQRDLFTWIGWFEESQDCLVQFISGCHHRAWYSKQYITENLNPWPRRTTDRSPDFFNAYNITFDQYKIARNHLLLMPWIGLTEHLSESVEQLKVFWNIKSNPSRIGKSNANKAKPTKDLSQEIIDKIKQYNKYDMQLWELGYVLFLQQKIVVKYGYNITN